MPATIRLLQNYPKEYKKDTYEYSPTYEPRLTGSFEKETNIGIVRMLTGRYSRVSYTQE